MQPPPKLKTDVRSVVLFLASFLLGGAAFIYILGFAFFSPDKDFFLWRAALVGLPGAFITAWIHAKSFSRENLIMHLGFPMPMLWFGVGCVFAVFKEGKPDYLWWLAFGVSFLLFGLLGAFAGRGYTKAK